MRRSGEEAARELCLLPFLDSLLPPLAAEEDAGGNGGGNSDGGATAAAAAGEPPSAAGRQRNERLAAAVLELASSHTPALAGRAKAWCAAVAETALALAGPLGLVAQLRAPMRGEEDKSSPLERMEKLIADASTRGALQPPLPQPGDGVAPYTGPQQPVAKSDVMSAAAALLQLIEILEAAGDAARRTGDVSVKCKVCWVEAQRRALLLHDARQQCTAARKTVRAPHTGLVHVHISLPPLHPLAQAVCSGGTSLSARLAEAAAEDPAVCEVLGPVLSADLRQAARAACCEAKGCHGLWSEVAVVRVRDVRAGLPTHPTCVRPCSWLRRSPTLSTHMHCRPATHHWLSSRKPWRRSTCWQASACWSWRWSRCVWARRVMWHAGLTSATRRPVGPCHSSHSSTTQDPLDALTGAANAPALRRLLAAAYRTNTHVDESRKQCAANACSSVYATFGWPRPPPVHFNVRPYARPRPSFPRAVQSFCP